MTRQSLWNRFLFVGFVGLVSWSCSGAKPVSGGSLSERMMENSGLGTVVDVVVGGQHACALHVGGKVSCWGRNHVGQLGDGSTTDRYWGAAVEGLDDAVKVVVGTGHSCALREGGEVVCWGANVMGLTGDGGDWRVERNIPAAVVPVAVSGVGGMRYGQKKGEQLSVCGTFAGLDNIVDIAASAGQTCVVDAEGGVACWGKGLADRRLQSFNNDIVPCPLPVYGDLGDVERLLGTDCALRKNGRVACWAWGYRSPFDDHKADAIFDPYVAVHQVSGKQLEDVATRAGCRVDPDGSVVCSGVVEPVFVDGVEGAVVVSIGGERELVLEAEEFHYADPVYRGEFNELEKPFGCAVLSNGGVSCWGNNDFGQSGGSGESEGANLVVFGVPEGVEHDAKNNFASIKVKPLSPAARMFGGYSDEDEENAESVDCPVMAEAGPTNAANVLRLDAWGKRRDFRFEDVAVLVGESSMRIVLPSLNYIGVAADKRSYDGWDKLEFRVALDGEPKSGDRLRVVLDARDFPTQLGCFANPMTFQGELHVKQVHLPKMGGDGGMLAGVIELYAGSTAFGGLRLEFETTSFATRTAQFDDRGSIATPYGILRGGRYPFVTDRVAKHDWREWEVVDDEQNYFVAGDGTNRFAQAGKATYDAGKRELLVNLLRRVDEQGNGRSGDKSDSFEMSFGDIELKPGIYQIASREMKENKLGFDVLELQEAVDGGLVGVVYRVVRQVVGEERGTETRYAMSGSPPSAGYSRVVWELNDGAQGHRSSGRVGGGSEGKRSVLIEDLNASRESSTVKLVGVGLDAKDKIASFSLDHVVIYPELAGYTAYDPAFYEVLRGEDAEAMRFVGLPAGFEQVLLKETRSEVVLSDSEVAKKSDDKVEPIRTLDRYRSVPFTQGDETLLAVREDRFRFDKTGRFNQTSSGNKVLVVDSVTLRPRRTVWRVKSDSSALLMTEIYASMREIRMDWHGDRVDVLVDDVVRGQEKTTFELPADIPVFAIEQTLLLLPHLDLKPGYKTRWKALDYEVTRGRGLDILADELVENPVQMRVWPKLRDVTLVVEKSERIEHDGQSVETLRAQLTVYGRTASSGTVWLEKDAPHRVVAFNPAQSGFGSSFQRVPGADELSALSEEIVGKPAEGVVPVVSDIGEMRQFFGAYEACEAVVYRDYNVWHPVTARSYEVLGASGDRCRVRVKKTMPKLDVYGLSATCLVPKGRSFKDDEEVIEAALKGGKSVVSCEGPLVESLGASLGK